MSDIKEIKSIRIVPYTLMNSSISAVVAFIYAIFIVLILGIAGNFLPSSLGITGGVIASLGVALLILLPAAGFVFSVTQSFLTALIYNVFVPRIGGIKLELRDMKEIVGVPVVPFALMLSAIGATIVFIAMLIIGPLIMIGLQAAVIGAAYQGTVIPGLSSIGALGIVGLLILIIGVPIVMFVASFIMTALTAIIYNLLAPKIGGIEFEFEALKEKLYGINSIPAVKLALITAIVMAIVNLIFEAISTVSSIAMGSSAVAGVISLLINVVVNLVVSFIIYAIMAVLYNYLAPKIGSVKVELE
ncbi:hypothetical protein [Methanobacterium congolense]|uniref:Uncharacterized protein n=1 Tax=Methanobacterium congolense TaxID=118062 RepID=A0A1D3KZJ2_9EURY|nr:hypothetical protein [Methanobacterium congolense]SCG84689.1 putative protein [Methanobacterium congolense]